MGGKYELSLGNSDSMGGVPVAVEVLERIREAETDAIPVVFFVILRIKRTTRNRLKEGTEGK